MGLLGGYPSRLKLCFIIKDSATLFEAAGDTPDGVRLAAGYLPDV